MARGKFIVFEGTDGSGKSTQIRLLGKYLSGKGIPVYLTHEPTDSPFGAILHACMTGRIETDEYTIAAMFAADRLDHLHNGVNGILKKLEEGTTVICDRYCFSSLAYNGGMVPLDWVTALNQPALANAPDLTIFLDVPPEEGMQRISHRGDTERYETLERQKKIREKYFEVFSAHPDHHVEIVESAENKDVTQARIRAAYEKVLGGKV